jgi:tetratricopeptide (TPR) repeat protein
MKFSLPYWVIFSAFICSPPAAIAQASYDRNHLTDLFQNDDYDEAISFLSSLPGQSGNPQYETDLGYALFMSGNYANARTAFQAVARVQPSNIKAQLYLAKANEELDLPDSALYHYLRLTNLAPGNYRHWQKATQLYIDKAMYDSAMECVKKGYAYNPSSGFLAVQFANVLIRLKKADEADSLITRFLQRDSSNREVIAKKVDLAYRKPDHRQVIRWGEQLLRDSVDMTLPYINLAYSYLNVDSFSKSIALCEWMINKNRAYPQILYCAALAHAKRKEYEASNDYLDKCIALSIQKEATMYLNAKSDNYEEMKQYRNSANYHDTSYYIFHSPPDLYYAGRIYDKYLNNPAKAASYYRQFLAKRKKPANSEEIRVFEYIDGFLKRQDDSRKVNTKR